MGTSKLGRHGGYAVRPADGIRAIIPAYFMIV
jgi:hypothetical protein